MPVGPSYLDFSRPYLTADAWSPSERFRALAVLYAIESAQPAISRTKLAGLVEHYGFDAADPAAEIPLVALVLDAVPFDAFDLQRMELAHGRLRQSQCGLK